MTLDVGIATTTEAARMVGVAPSTIRWWVAKGYLAPVRAGAKPLRFRESDVWRCARDRMPSGEAARLDALWERIGSKEGPGGPAVSGPRKRVPGG